MRFLYRYRHGEHVKLLFYVHELEWLMGPENCRRCIERNQYFVKQWGLMP